MLLFFDFGSRILATNDETRFPLLARDILAHGHWLLPELQGAAHLNKPPLTAWLIAMASWPTGLVTQSSAALPSVLAALGVILATSFIARRLFDTDVALKAGLIVLTTYGVFTLARVPMPDIALCAAFTAAMAAYVVAEFQNQGTALVAFYFLVGVAFWVKGPVGLLPLVVVLLDQLTTHGWLGPRRLRSTSGLVLLVLMVVPWWVLVGTAGRQQFVQDIVIIDWLRWYLPTQGWTWRQLTEPVLQTATILLPWSPLLLPAIWSAARAEDPARARQTRLLLVWMAAAFVLTAVSYQQRMRYYLPLCPPGALLIAVWYAGRSLHRRAAVFASGWMVVALGLSLWQAQADVRHNAATDLSAVADTLRKDPRPLYTIDAPELVFAFYFAQPVVVLHSYHDFEPLAADGYLIVSNRTLRSWPGQFHFREVATARVGGRPVALLTHE